MKSLITGINGFVGGYLKQHLLSLGHDVCGIDHHSHNKDTFAADITDRDRVCGVVKDLRPDAIFHLAGIANVAHGNVGDFYTIHAIGTLNVYEAVREAGINPRILYISSSNVYGIVPEDMQPIGESQPIKPANHYGASKAAGEMISYKYIADGMDIIIARSFNHTGPGQSESFIIPKLARAFVSRQTSIELGITHTKRDFTDVRDVVRAYGTIVRKARAGDVYNVCSGKAYSIDDIIGRLGGLTDHAVHIHHADSLKRAVDPVLFVGDNRRLKGLGWSVEIPLERTLKDTLDFYRDRVL